MREAMVMHLQGLLEDSLPVSASHSLQHINSAMAILFIMTVITTACAPRATPTPSTLPATGTPAPSSTLTATPFKAVSHRLPTAAVSREQPTSTVSATIEPYPFPATTPSAVIEPYPFPTTTPTAPPTPHATVTWHETTLTIPTYQYKDALYADPDSPIYPYPKLDRAKVGPPQPRDYHAVVVENEYIALTLLPELGGRIYRLVFKPTGQNLTYNNAVIKPTHWGPPEQGWWLAVGGYEFCLPVDEHGYLTAEPWDYVVEVGEAGNVTVVLSQYERTRDLAVSVDVTVYPQSAAVEIHSRVAQSGLRRVEFQYWINAMLTLGTPRVSPQTEFIYPTDRVIIHSTGDAELPQAGEEMSWPVYDGRDMSRYANWRDWLGFFVPEAKYDFVGAYNHETDLGIVRVFNAAEMPGIKLFAFGQEFGHRIAFTDDDNDYFEIWGGATRTFGDYATLEKGETREWQEWWYPIWRTGGFDYANRAAALRLRRSDRPGALTINVAVSAPMRGTVALLANDEQIFAEAVNIAPDQPYSAEIPISVTDAELSLRLLSADGAVIAQYNYAIK